jgi:DNA-binding transcriptional LysR family regulator
MLDVKQLRVLKEVAACGSFSAAAESLNYTQPAISQQVAALERSTGSVLVDRNSRGVRLTDAGRALVEHAEAVLTRLAAAEAELEAIAGVRGGRLRLASFSTAGALIAPPALKLFATRFPEVELSLLDAEPADSARMLRQAELEVALVLDYTNVSRSEFERIYDGVELTHLLDDPMYLALPRDHPHARRRQLRLEDLADETWVQAGDGPCGRVATGACNSAGFDPRIGFMSDDYTVVQGLVAAGMGVALLPALVLTNIREDIVIRSLGPTAPCRRIAAATLAGHYRSPATAAMLEILLEVGLEFELPTGTALAA